MVQLTPIPGNKAIVVVHYVAPFPGWSEGEEKGLASDIHVTRLSSLAQYKIHDCMCVSFLVSWAQSENEADISL